MADDSSGDFMLTTIDNPWNPYTDYDEWYLYDQSHGYNTPGYLARIAKTSDDLSDADNDLAISEAIDEIIQLNINGMMKKVSNPNTITQVAVETG
jgi:hypothetical protein